MERTGHVWSVANSRRIQEYKEARDRKHILLFVQEGVTPDPLQAKFLTEVQGWQEGHFRAGFRTPDELRDLVTGAVHRYQIATAAAPLDALAIAQSAIRLLPPPRGAANYAAEVPMLNFCVAGGPSQRLLRPAELEAAALTEELQRQAMFGERRVFDRSKATKTEMRGASLILEQDGGATVQLDEQGALVLRLPLSRPSGQTRRGLTNFFAIIEEDVVRELTNAIAYVNWCLDSIDPSQTLDAHQICDPN